MFTHKISLFLAVLTGCMSEVAPDVGSRDENLITCPDDVCTGGGGGQTYQDYLDGLPTVYLTHQTQALGIVASVFQIPPSYISGVYFVPRPTTILDQNGLGVSGVAYLSSVWVSWTGAQWTSGASADGPAISSTDFAYEVGRVACSPSNPPSIVVGQANAALQAAGL